MYSGAGDLEGAYSSCLLESAVGSSNSRADGYVFVPT